MLLAAEYMKVSSYQKILRKKLDTFTYAETLIIFILCVFFNFIIAAPGTITRSLKNSCWCPHGSLPGDLVNKISEILRKRTMLLPTASVWLLGDPLLTIGF